MAMLNNQRVHASATHQLLKLKNSPQNHQRLASFLPLLNGSLNVTHLIQDDRCGWSMVESKMKPIRYFFRFFGLPETCWNYQALCQSYWIHLGSVKRYAGASVGRGHPIFKKGDWISTKQTTIDFNPCSNYPFIKLAINWGDTPVESFRDRPIATPQKMSKSSTMTSINYYVPLF